MPIAHTGTRGHSIRWQHSFFPITIVQRRSGGQPSPESSVESYTCEDLEGTAYDGQVVAAYAILRELKASASYHPNCVFNAQNQLL